MALLKPFLLAVISEKRLCCLRNSSKLIIFTPPLQNGGNCILSPLNCQTRPTLPEQSTTARGCPHWFCPHRFGAGRARSDVFDGPAWRGVSEVKRTFGFCLRRSVVEVKKISPAAPHHRKVSAPRPPLRLKTQPKSHSPTAMPQQVPHSITPPLLQSLTSSPTNHI